ncbi:hypothetical protein EUTSA_v10006408mg, partial [Eutrema salsugineum]
MVPDQRNKGKEKCSPEPQTQPQSLKHDPDMPSSSSSAPSYLSPRDHVCRPGFRFSPTDEELVLHYLEPFSKSRASSWPVHHVNIYESNPQRLSAEYEKGNLTEWFFVSERTNMHKGGKRQNRSDNGGYWHATGTATKFKAGNGVVGNKASLVYYTGRQPNGVKTNWLIKEYWLDPSSSDDNMTVGYALYKIYQTPVTKKKKKEEGVEALKEDPLDINEYQQSYQPQFWPTTLDSHQCQPHGIVYHQPQLLDTNEYHQPHQPQPLDIN